ncbi:MAG: hypothetical protein QQN63_10230 [Nitrosopumilus sp.]
MSDIDIICTLCKKQVMAGEITVDIKGEDFCGQICATYHQFPTVSSYLLGLKAKQTHQSSRQQKSISGKAPALAGTSQNFDPHYNRALGQEVHSYKDMENKLKHHQKEQKELSPENRDHQHPDGMVMTNDIKSQMKDEIYASKHKREYKEHQDYLNGINHNAKRGTAYSLPSGKTS